jgi:hypothetical protein
MPHTWEDAPFRSLMAVITSVCNRLNYAEDYLHSLSRAYERSQNMNKALIDATRAAKEKTTENLSDEKEWNWSFA